MTTVPIPRQGTGVLRLRGGGSESGSPSPSPPPTRPASPEANSDQVPRSRATRPTRPAASDRSRSGRSRLQSVSPEKRHSEPGLNTRRTRGRSLGRGRPRVQESKQTPKKSASRQRGSGPFFCSNNCNAQFSTDRGRIDHENYHCRANQPQQVIMFGYIKSIILCHIVF